MFVMYLLPWQVERKKKNMKFDFFVIGTGGTGTYFLKEFARFAIGNESVGNIHLFDGDTVEERNLKRQCFQKEDIGRNKAAVMAEILNDAFELNMTAHVCYLTGLEQIEELLSESEHRIPVFIGCVDNHGCRLLLEALFEKLENCILFDSANEYVTGEVVYAYKRNGTVYGPPRSAYFPQIKEGDIRNRGEISCEELNQVSPQHIFTNMMAGNLLCAAVANLLAGQITPGFSYFNSLAYESGFHPAKRKEEFDGR